MAGLGFKDFAVGEVLTAADVDGYLMQQSVMRFADSAARGSALGTATGTGVPLAEGMVAYLDDANQVQVFDGTVWRPTGTVLQVAQTVKTDSFTTTSTSFVSVTGMSVSITPSKTTSKILVVATMNVSMAAGGYYTATRLKRGATDILLGDAAGSRTRATTAASEGSGGMTWVQTISYLDSPATTSSTDYSLDIAILNSTGQIVAVNRTVTDTDSTLFQRTASTITAIEVAA